MGLDNSWAGRYEPLADKIEDTTAHCIVGIGVIAALPLMLLAIGASKVADKLRGDSRQHCPDDGL